MTINVPCDFWESLPIVYRLLTFIYEIEQEAMFYQLQFFGYITNKITSKKKWTGYVAKVNYNFVRNPRYISSTPVTDNRFFYHKIVNNLMSLLMNS